jgi:uncharacterized protein (DUF736 family)
MTQIGRFAATDKGLAGHLHFLTLDVRAVFIPLDKDASGKAPDYRIHLGDDRDGPEIGAGWKRTAEKAGDYIAVIIDDPTFTEPIRATLFQSDRHDGSWSLHWARPRTRNDRAQ